MTTVTNRNGVEFDIDAIATDLNGKMDVDTLNASDTGKSYMAGYALPSDTYEDLTLGASFSTYIAPANGYFLLQKIAGYSGQYIQLENLNSGMVYFCNASGGFGLSAFMPALKGDEVQVQDSTSGSTLRFRFIYAQGSESEAS